ncbi:hypothetical protein [Streptomyces sp. SID3343]|uniref:HIT family protein n=1 Tax=Streptomyces sp. SID3343 TaxID=2690260 RepID=UPI00136ABA58|nr:hypothetical protein [Streptomyces sp. SID3343]MYW05389.1 hypothetical protein [Streptomyces sp. SID3343]
MRARFQCDGSDLCEELRGSSATAFSLVYQGDPESRTICATAHLRVLADLSPLCVGHLLLLPIEHYPSFARLISDGSAELADLLAEIVPRYLDTFGALTIVEHGSSLDMTSTACISHAHWHLLPIAGGAVNRLILADGLTPVEVPSLDDLPSVGGQGSYFFCLDDTGMRLYRAESHVRGQYLRSIVGRILGIPDPLWDYSVSIRPELLRETMVRTSRWSSDVAGNATSHVARVGRSTPATFRRT